MENMLADPSIDNFCLYCINSVLNLIIKDQKWKREGNVIKQASYKSEQASKLRNNPCEALMN